MESIRIIIASPHDRDDRIQLQLRERWSDLKIFRVRSIEELAYERVSEINPRYIFFPHWSWHIQEKIFENYECVIFHMSDLPYGRGGSPLQNLIVRGHGETMLTALRCVDELDAGPIYFKRPLSLLGTAEEILTNAAELIEQIICEFINTSPEPVAQKGEVTVFTRRRPIESNIAKIEELKSIYDYIRMLDADGYPPAFLETTHFRIEFTQAKFASQEVLANVRFVRKT